MKKYNHIILLVSAILVLTVACRKEPKVTPAQQETLFTPETNSNIAGLFLLNEGNMNMNKASLDYIDYQTGIYHRNIFGQANPTATKGLGDVGNDIAVYGSKLYVVINVSNKIEVLDKHTYKRIKQIDLLNCRSMAFGNGKAYISAYLGKVGDASAPNGIVAELDTASLEITRKVMVGRQPEEMAVVNNKLYVANSGGYSPPNYERTLSVIDLNSFSEIKRIDVAINLNQVKVDAYGDLYVSSRGNYYDVPSKLYVIDTHTDLVKHQFDVPVSNMCILGDTAYIISTAWNYPKQENEISYTTLDVKNEKVLSGKFINDGTEKQISVPYGIIVNPQTKDVLITDAGNYVSPGTLFCFDSSGRKKWSIATGDIPAHMTFIYK